MGAGSGVGAGKGVDRDRGIDAGGGVCPDVCMSVRSAISADGIAVAGSLG